MTRTDSFRLQPDEWLAITRELEQLLHPQALAADARRARSGLNGLMARLVLHRTLEGEAQGRVAAQPCA